MPLNEVGQHLAMNRFETEEEISELVKAFEDAGISREDWKHAEHLAVALYYVSHYGEAAALEKMRGGIMDLLVNGFGVDTVKEMPYHETLTVFWIRTISRFAAENTTISLLDKTNLLIKTHDKEMPSRFYSKEHLFSERARIEFVEPDLAEFI
jgi:hypothetical protein